MACPLPQLKALLSTLEMSFTTIQPSDNRSKAPHYGLVEDAEVTQDVVHEKDAKRPKPFVMRGASVTIIAMTAPYVLGTKITPPLRRLILFPGREVAHCAVTLLILTHSKECASPPHTSFSIPTSTTSESISIRLFPKAGCPQ
jgi:hypothetical protein